MIPQSEISFILCIIINLPCTNNYVPYLQSLGLLQHNRTNERMVHDLCYNSMHAWFRGLYTNYKPAKRELQKLSPDQGPKAQG